MYADTNTVSKADGRAVPWNKDRETIEPCLQCHVLAGVDLTERLRSDYFECGRGQGTSTKGSLILV
jgi:hypothetical protein